MEVKLQVYEMLSGTSIELEVLDLLVSRLASFGVELTVEDSFLVGFSLMKSHQAIINFCGIIYIPKELYCTVVDLTIADILASFKANGKLDYSVSSVNIGDTSVSFNSNCIDDIISQLQINGKDELVCFRKVHW